MFEFKKVKNQKNKAYTHHIYFKGKLFAKEAYKFGNEFHYDDGVHLNEKELMSIPFAKLPDKLQLKLLIENAYKKLNFCGVIRKGNMIEFNFFIDTMTVLELNPEFNIFRFIFFTQMLSKRYPGFKLKFDNEYIDVYYLCVPKKTIGESYKDALRILDNHYTEVDAKIKEVEKYFSKQKLQ